MPWLRLFLPLSALLNTADAVPGPTLRESMALTAVIRGVSAPSFVLYSKRIRADSVKEPEWLGNG